MMKPSKKRKGVAWTDVMEDGECVGKEAKLKDLFDIKEIRSCCEKPNLWFQIIDASPVTNHFRVICKVCNKIGKSTGWSWSKAVALWNSSLWNLEHSKPLKLARQLRSCKLAEMSLGDIKDLLIALEEVPEILENLVVKAESSRMELYNKEKE